MQKTESSLITESSFIVDVKIKPLKIIETVGGPVLHMLRNDGELFTSFGEVYFSELEPKAIKAWKKHKLQTQNICVPFGKVLFVIYDNREASKSFGRLMKVVLGRPENYSLLQIPPGLWYGFTALDDKGALVANCADIPHLPEESERIDANSTLIPYQWGL
ncbi:dTDP-4-dehydrorhamnose 3,5-epimerase family protein [Desulfovibrio litoralis]|uniref:dTDP-4-dehydrorhamnose 3,5-epimerase n=1 Tax=Desulfovibrio litoralis DSM 11393 TaxID=1121455 RepID=A0A1M7SRG1_9BACT|nr:dTDP-4-dehydrorhamnose 3,5-epimerase family protein [Desulfovibrio litoralis]SHN60968.1 dTDP-4-dehydrorhamnose 3,5-epimerase [Desulfovibrio litoralis DSM 11393]